MHTCEYYDVMEQTRLAEEVAPEGFKIHYDFNSNRSLAAVLPIVRELENHRVVGFIEDPIVRNDIDGWRRLREQSRLPIIMHAPQLGGVQEIIHGLADAYMVGESGIGDSLIRGFACGEGKPSSDYTVDRRYTYQSLGTTYGRCFTYDDGALGKSRRSV